ncbi:hypothetical protein PNI0446_02419 [Streptococcus pneumoniae PNI0446]|nr:hypothetical protein PNI0446_02419 [Streptococcus pneumoniae PNI0446]
MPQDHLVFTIEKVVNTDEKEVNHLIKPKSFIPLSTRCNLQNP